MAALTEDNDPLIGRVIDGRFTIQGVLGRGGMGVVYRAHQASLERSVALKLMTGVPPERAAEFQRRFFLEAATAARLKHPNTITVFDYGSSVLEDAHGHEENVFYITMELLEGITLSRLLARGRSLPPLRAIHIGLQIARSLREAHKAGVVHRDLKPGNVMLVRQDEADDVEGDFVKVLDFGLAKSRGHDGAGPMEGITKAGTFMGSPRYVAPEQVEGRVVDHRADIYSFGCLLYRMLSGRVPFDGQQAVEIMLKHIHEPAPPLAVSGLPLTLVRLVEECLAKDPAGRPASMDAVGQRLKLARAELGGQGSGIVVLSDERASSLPEEEPIFPLEEVVAPLTRPSSSAREPSKPQVSSSAAGSLPAGASAAAVSSSAAASGAVSAAAPAARASGPAVPARTKPVTDPGAVEMDWSLGRPMSVEDSTRPTRVLGHISLKKPPRRPWVAIASGVVIGLALCGYGVAWRLGSLDPVLERFAELRAPTTSASPAPAAAAPPLAAGPFARQARVRIKTEPAGADVLEVVDGLPRLLGITPLTLDWKIDEPRAREILLRKEGYAPSRAVLSPPAPGAHEPVWLDVEATLRRP